MLASLVLSCVALPKTKKPQTMSRRNKTGRTSTLLHPIILHQFKGCKSAAILTAILQVPAFFSSCEHVTDSTEAHTEPQIYIQWTKNPTSDAIDLFFFDTLGAQKLDTYQQILDVQGPYHPYGVSGPGAKRLVALSGTAGLTDPWLDILNYGSLCKKTYRLEEEDLGAPRLVAETLLEMGASRVTLLYLQPMLTQIRIRSVSCDFSGRPYTGKFFSNSKLYLTYAGTEYKPLGPGGGHPVSWINAGALDSLATLALPRPEMVLQKGLGDIGPSRQYPDIRFYCYANPGLEEGIPHTRLVLEGTVDGQLCYYPLEIPHLEAGKVYSYDITLRRMGSPDPDIPVSSDAVLVETLTVPWERREPSTVTF